MAIIATRSHDAVVRSRQPRHTNEGGTAKSCNYIHILRGNFVMHLIVETSQKSVRDAFPCWPTHFMTCLCNRLHRLGCSPTSVTGPINPDGRKGASGL